VNGSLNTIAPHHFHERSSSAHAAERGNENLMPETPVKEYVGVICANRAHRNRR
jgi:hypothetical protein